MRFDNPLERKGSFGAALAWMLGLTIVLGWLPVLGWFVPGFVAGRKTRALNRTLAAALIVAALGAALCWGLNDQLLPVGKTSISLPFIWFAPVFAGFVLAGAFAGVPRRGAWSASLLAMLIGIGATGGIFWTHRDDFSRMVSLLAPQKGAATAEETAEDRNCPERLKKLYKAFQVYTLAGDPLPKADQWQEAIKANTEDENFHCPSLPKGQFGYAMNAALAGKKLDAIPDAGHTPLLFDSSDLSPNAHGDLKLLPSPARHAGHNYILYADGSVGQK